MLRLFDAGRFVEVDAEVEADPSSPGFGDAQLNVRVQSEGFVGGTTAWVDRDALAQFGRAVIALNASLRGEALLTSMVPNELKLVLRSVTARGTMAVEGSIGREIFGRDSRFWHAISFGF